MSDGVNAGASIYPRERTLPRSLFPSVFLLRVLRDTVVNFSRRDLSPCQQPFDLPDGVLRGDVTTAEFERLAGFHPLLDALLRRKHRAVAA